MGEKEGTAVIVGAAVFVSFSRMQGASSLWTQYRPESIISEAQQSDAVVPVMLLQPLPPQMPHIPRQQTVPFASFTPSRPLEQLDGAIPAISPKTYAGGNARGVEGDGGSTRRGTQGLVVAGSN